MYTLVFYAALCPAVLTVTPVNPRPRINDVSYETRAHWIRRANEALEGIGRSPCPFAAFGTVIVNHTDSDTGTLVCMGVNENAKTGNPSLHGTVNLTRTVRW